MADRSSTVLGCGEHRVILANGAAIGNAHIVAAHVIRLRHLSAVDDWLAELERAHGPIPPETMEWAAQIVERWESKTRPRGNRGVLMFDELWMFEDLAVL